MTNQHSHHAIDTDASLEAMQATAGGLRQDDVAARRAIHGPNLLPQPPRRSVILRFLAHFHNILIYVLIGSGGS